MPFYQTPSASAVFSLCTYLITRMEGIDREAFESLNLNPQIFINETLNTVDDLLDDAFHFYHQEASTLLKTEGTDRSHYLSRGIAHIRNKMLMDLDSRLGMWEKYCLHHVFSVPKGFALPQSRESPDETSMCQDLFSYSELDAQLNSLRDRLAMIGKETSKLNHELQSLERQSASSDHCAELVSEAMQLYEHKTVQDMFQEMLSIVSELRTKMENLRTRRMENIECARAKRILDPNRESLMSSYSKGITNVTLEDLQEFIADLKHM